MSLKNTLATAALLGAAACAPEPDLVLSPDVLESGCPNASMDVVNLDNGDLGSEIHRTSLHAPLGDWRRDVNEETQNLLEERMDALRNQQGNTPEDNSTSGMHVEAISPLISEMMDHRAGDEAIFVIFPQIDEALVTNADIPGCNVVSAQFTIPEETNNINDGYDFAVILDTQALLGEDASAFNKNMAAIADEADTPYQLDPVETIADLDEMKFAGFVCSEGRIADAEGLLECDQVLTYPNYQVVTDGEVSRNPSVLNADRTVIHGSCVELVLSNNNNYQYLVIDENCQN